MRATRVSMAALCVAVVAGCVSPAPRRKARPKKKMPPPPRPVAKVEPAPPAPTVSKPAPREYSYEPNRERPLFRDFMGLNGHTVKFKPELYAPTCRLARDYHGLNWDVGDDTSFETQFPFARNRVNWDNVYGRWKKGGFEIDASVMFKSFKPGQWKDMKRDAHLYGKAFASFFGPSSPKALVAAAEIGNEPGNYGDEEYRTVFENMARGFREGDPKLKVVTCNITVGKGGKYDKSVTCVAGLEHLYDVLNIHSYAQVEGWPTWRRSFPEDPGIEYLKSIERLVTWRDENALGKEIWITEFGYDCSTKPQARTGTFKKWVGVTDLQQAQYLVRSFLVFAKLDVDRAYIYFFDDNDSPRVHGAAGLTRKYQPKMSYYAVSHLYESLGAYRLKGVVWERPGASYVYEFVHGDDAAKRVLVAWSPTGGGKSARVEIPLSGAKVERAERSPLTPGKPPAVDVTVTDDRAVVSCEETPLFVWIRAPGGE